MPEDDLLGVQTTADGPAGRLPLTEELLREAPSGDVFALSQNAGMGWEPARTRGDEFLVLSTQGGVRADDGTPVALGYHTGHWEVGLLVREAAAELARLGALPFAAHVTDPCDGRSQGTPAMFDSLAYRNDAAVVLRRLVRSLPNRRGVLGVATCDKGLPAMLMAVASFRSLAGGIVPGGVTLPPRAGEDAGTVQTLGARFAHGLVTLEDAAALGCAACATPGGGCQFLGTAATAQVVAEALGLTVPHAALAPSGQPIWLDVARRTAAAVHARWQEGRTLDEVLTPEAVENAMLAHAAFGGSTNLLIHLPAIAHAAGLPRPTVDDWQRVNRAVPRLVDALPNGPHNHPTVRVFLAGGVPEVMLHLRRLGLLARSARTIAGRTWDEVLDEWEQSERRRALRERLREADGVDPDDVISPPARARAKGMTSTVCFPRGNLAPLGSVIKSTALDPRLLDGDGVFRMTGRARVFTTEPDVIAAIKGTAGEPLVPGDVVVLAGRGPLGSGMEETYQLTSALKFLPTGREIALVTDARFSGVSTGPCIGHVSPEALEGGPIGRLRDGDRIRIVVDTVRLEASLDLVGHGEEEWSSERAAAELERRQVRPDVAPDPRLPADTALWARLQSASGGLWGGCVYDPEAILSAIADGGAASRAAERDGGASA
ncbi:MAG TPA: YjhG/YagF family D-xylonate dehydratase [Gaiellaceae bacterium]|nr:YjhG/YagF family D-xylonate dehydratase [Gaiellaceae bacterium]